MHDGLVLSLALIPQSLLGSPAVEESELADLAPQFVPRVPQPVTAVCSCCPLEVAAV